MKKYRKRTESIDGDFQYYLGRESLHHYFFGHKMKPTERAKVDYIWKALLKEHKKI